MRQAGLGGQERTVQMDRQKPLPVLEREILQFMNDLDTPQTMAALALKSLNIPRGRKSCGCGNAEVADETRSQKARRRWMRRSGGLPAINAALIAPIETPATHSVRRPLAKSASNAPA